MDANEYQILSRRTRRMDLRLIERINNAVLGIAGEAGEIVEAHKKTLYHGHDMDGEQVRDELGDLFFYAAWLADEYGWTLEEIMQSNVNKLRRRFPDGFSTEASLARVDVNGGDS